MRTETNKTSLWNNVGVFCAFTLLGAMAFALFSPVVATNAANTLRTSTTAQVNAVISLTVPSADDYDFGTITPTAAGQFASKSGTVQVKTNSINGYKLYISNNTSETRMVSTGSDTFITACGANVTSSTMAANTWGYSTNGTNYNPISASNTQIGEKTSPLTQTSPYSHTVHIGLKVASNLKAGVYMNTVKFTALTN